MSDTYAGDGRRSKHTRGHSETGWKEVPVRVSISTPSGKCPVALEDDSEDSIELWVFKVRSRCSRAGRNLAPDAVAYYLREFIPVDDPRREQVEAVVRGCFGEE